MITTTVGELRQQSVQHAINKIKQCTVFDPGYGFQIGCVIKDLEKEFNKFEQEAYAKYAELSEKNEDGSVKFEEKEFNGMKYQNYVFSEENKKVADDVAVATASNAVILGHRPKLNLSKLIGAKLNPVELVAIEFMIDDTK